MRSQGSQQDTVHPSTSRPFWAIIVGAVITAMALMGSAPPAAAAPDRAPTLPTARPAVSCISNVKQTLPVRGVRTVARPLTPLCSSPTPSFSTPVRTVDGFTVNVTNYDALYTWTATIPPGASVSKGSAVGASLPLTVTGLAAGGSGTVTVTVTRVGYSQGSNTVTGYALNAALNPTYDNLVSTADGFTVDITNYDDAYVYNPTVTSGSVDKGTASGSTLPLTVTGLAAGASATVTTTTTRTGYVTGTADQEGNALYAARNPSYEVGSRTVDGFTMDIVNYSDSWSWDVDVDKGSVSAGTPVGSTMTLTVTGLDPDTEATITTTTKRAGYADGTGQDGWRSLAAALTPTFDTPVVTDDGFTVNITNYDADWDWSAKGDSGLVEKGVPADGKMLLTLTGVATGDLKQITVWNERKGYVDGEASVTPSGTQKEQESTETSSGGSAPLPEHPHIVPLPKYAGQQPGHEFISEDGLPQEVKVTWTDNGVVLVGTGFRLQLTGITSTGDQPTTSQTGQVIFTEDGLIRFSGSGLEPGTYAYVFMFSEPKLVGKVLVGADGTFSGTLALPAGLLPGDHTLQLNGVTTSNEVRSISMGVQVTAPTTTAAASPVTAKVATRVYFDYQSAKLTPAAKRHLTALAAQVPVSSATHAVVVGVVRSEGSDDADVALAKQRAKAVADFLKGQGLTAKLAVRTQAAHVGNTPKDRRVHITITFTR